MNMQHTTSDEAIKTLRVIFQEQPELLDIVTLSDLQAEQLLEHMRVATDLFTTHVNAYFTGRTTVGKTSIGNTLFGQEVMNITGHMNCTDYVGLIKLKSNLWYFDTPGAGDPFEEKFENVTRSALGLPPRPGEETLEFELHDYTQSRRDKNTGGVIGVVKNKIQVKQWQSPEWSQEFSPAVIVVVIAPHMLMGGDDRAYLRDMLAKYGERVVFALNIHRTASGEPKATPQNIEDVQRIIRRIWQELYPALDIGDRIVIVDAKRGTGLDLLAAQICRVLPSHMLGNIETVLNDQLKGQAERERARRFRRTLHRIAGRLALYPVDQKLGHQSLIGTAAAGIAQYAALTFRDARAVAELRHDLDATIDLGVKRLREMRSQLITEKHPIIRERQLKQEQPIFEEVEAIDYIVQKVVKEVPRRERKGFWDQLQVSLDVVRRKWETIAEQAGQFIRRENDTIWSQIDREAEELRYRVKTVMEEVEESVPVKRVQQRLKGYEEKVIGTIQEVTGFTEKVVGEKALAGGVPAIEFLVGVGMGVRSYCLHADEGAKIEEQVEAMQDQVRLLLGRYARELDELIQQGVRGEAQLVQLLDDNLSTVGD